MGESQWFQPLVRNRMSQALVLANFSIKYGKFYDINHAYTEGNSAQGVKIQSKSQHEWGHSGRESSPTRTEGSFDVQLESGDKIGEIYWDCPWSGSNKIEKRYVKPGYDITVEGFSVPSGALGKGTIGVRED